MKAADDTRTGAVSHSDDSVSSTSQEGAAVDQDAVAAPQSAEGQQENGSNDNNNVKCEQQKTDVTEEVGEEEEEDSEDEGIVDAHPEDLDAAGRNALFERGQMLQDSGKMRRALRCYLQCLTGLKDAATFTFLPSCLRRVADIYFQQDDVEKAIQFIQAEKMFYETALIDTSQIEHKLELATAGGDAVTKETDPDVLRADEYEKLARMCLHKQQARLALEYQGKATRLRQKVLGDAHPVTVASLDYFTVIYADVGKQQYSESLGRLDAAAGGEGGGSPTSILRRRRAQQQAPGSAAAAEDGSPSKKQVRFHEPPVASRREYSTAQTDETEEWVSRVLLLCLFAVCILFLAAMAGLLYCRVATDTDTCRAWKADAYHWYMRTRYWWYYFTSPRGANVG